MDDTSNEGEIDNDHDGNGIAINVDKCDSPTKEDRNPSPVDFFLLNRLARDRMSRRSSLRSSITSIDSVHLKTKYSNFQHEVRLKRL